MPSKPERRKEMYREKTLDSLPVKALGAAVMECTKAIAQAQRNLQPKATHCLRGHPRTPENVRANGTCIICEQERRDTERKPPKTHCSKGHPLVPENLNSKDLCLTCARAKNSEHKKRQRRRKLLLPKYCRRGHLVTSRLPNGRRAQCPECVRINNKVKFASRRARKVGAVGRYTSREEFALRDFYDYRCLCCWKTETEIEALGLMVVLDHVIPLAKGGSGSILNMQPLCHHRLAGVAGCNEHKGVEDTDYRLLQLQGLS